MRLLVNLLSFILFAVLAKASFFSPFIPAESWDDQITSNETSHDLVKRQSNGCPTSYKACSAEGAPGLCCASSQTCTADTNGYVACCPSGAACTGTITGIVTGGTIAGAGGVLATGSSTSNNNLLTSVVSSATTSASNGLILASATSTTSGATSTQGFIVAASTTVATIGSSGIRSIRTPLYARLIIGLLEYLPL